MLREFLKDRPRCRVAILPMIYLSVLGFTAPQKLTEARPFFLVSPVLGFSSLIIVLILLFSDTNFLLERLSGKARWSCFIFRVYCKNITFILSIM